MPRTKPFASEYVISDIALRYSNIDLRAIARKDIEDRTESRGPRGGRYILGPVERWDEFPGDDFTNPGVTVIHASRTGTYVRPRHETSTERRSATTAKAMR